MTALRSAVTAPAVPARCREFVVDAPAKMLRRNPCLTKNARRLYLAMRALADGRTGELRIGDRWLRAEAIDAAAEMCRCIRLRCMRELIAAGLVSFERERILRKVRGRNRMVLGRSRYIVHRFSTELSRESIVPPSGKTRVLLQSISSTVEEIDRQVVSRRPVPTAPPNAGFDFQCLEGGESAKSSPTPRAQKARHAQMTIPFHPCFEDFKTQFPAVTARQFAFAVERILSRAKNTPCTRHYWQRSFENFFADLAGETEIFLRDLVLLDGPDADLSDVAARLKDEACDRDLYWSCDILDRAINQARSRFERDALTRSELQRG